MTKKYADTAFIYAIIAMVFGVFYREFTKFSQFTGKTSLAFLHTHYFMLGMFFFLILMLLEKNFHFSGGKHIRWALMVYHVGLNITGIGFLARGLTQVWGTELKKAVDASISGIAGAGHILIAVGMIVILLQVKKQAE